MTLIFNYLSAYDYIKDWHEKTTTSLSKGRFKTMADRMGVAQSLLSMIFNGSRLPTAEQAFALGFEMGLEKTELEYFSLLVEYEKAVKPTYKSHIKKKLLDLADGSKETGLESLTELQKIKFYSDWKYSAIRLLLGKENGMTCDEVSLRLGLRIPEVKNFLSFLCQAGLAKKIEDHFITTVKNTHISSSQKLSNSHHSNWRIKAIDHIPTRKKTELFFTSPMTMSNALFAELKEELETWIENRMQKVDISEPEILCCLNIDCFKIEP